MARRMAWSGLNLYSLPEEPMEAHIVGGLRSEWTANWNVGLASGLQPVASGQFNELREAGVTIEQH